MKRLGVLIATLLMLLVPLSAGAQSQEDPVHLGLGDSVAWGFGTDRPDHHGYTAVLNRYAHGFDCREGQGGCPQLELVNLAIPGATSQSLIDVQLGPAIQLLSERNTDADASNDVKLISITIGGNDLFNPVIAACAGGVTPECQAVIANGFASYSANLATILGSLRAAAGPTTEIAIMTYYNPLGACFLSDLEPLADLVLEGGGPLPFGLNDIIRGVAAATNVTVVETFGELGLSDFVGGADCLHPDKSGYHKIAKLFQKQLG